MIRLPLNAFLTYTRYTVRHWGYTVLNGRIHAIQKFIVQ